MSPSLAACVRRLHLLDATVVEGAGPNVDGVFEFGKLCQLAKVQIVNVGEMPSPAHTRLR